MLRVREREATLLDLLDRLLDKGVVVAGDLTLSVAEVDLIFASLRLVVTSVDKIREVQGGPSPDWGPHPSPGNGGGPGAGSGPTEDQVGKAGLPPPDRGPAASSENGGGPVPAFSPPGNPVGEAPGLGGPGLPAAGGDPSPLEKDEGNLGNADIDPDKAANGLAQLVLTLAELLRQLMERETLRRMERGTLTPREMERLGRAFFLMEQKMQQMREAFHLQEEDLNLDLGPLGKLM